jgi:ABC-type transporter Mla subunit MlaD
MSSLASFVERCRRPICLCSDWILWFALGITLLVSLLAMDWQALPFMPREEKTLHLFVEDAYSITKGSPVLFMGVKVGYITRVLIDPYDQSVSIDYALDNPSFKIPENADALIVAAGLGGAKSLEFTLHNDKVIDHEVVPSRVAQAHVTQPFRQKTMWHKIGRAHV